MNETQNKTKKILDSTSGAIWIIILFTFAIYFNALFNGFVDDDHTAIVRNTWLRDFSNIYALFHSSVWGFEEGREASNYFRPLYSLINMVEFHVFGLNPMGWHFFNVMLHAVNSAMVFLVTRRLLDDKESPSNLLPLFAGLIFASHPIHTEAAAWASPIGELTFSFFFLVSFLFYIKARKDATRKPEIKYYALSILAFFLGTLCKETVLTLLLFLLAYDFLRAEKQLSTALKGMKYHVPYWAVAGVYFLLRLNAFGAIVPREPMHPYLNQFQYGLNAVTLAVKYLTALVLPINLISFHPFEPVYSPIELKFIASLVSLAIVFVILIRMRKATYLYALSLSAMLIPLIVVLYTPVLDRNTYAERYLYLSVAGFALLIAVIAKHYINAGRDKSAGTKRVVIALIVLLFVYSAGTIKRNFEWKDDFTLWNATVKKDPDNYFILERLAGMYLVRNDTDTAISMFERSVIANSARQDPDPRVLMFALMKLGDAYRMKNMPIEALLRYESAQKLAPMRNDINMRLGSFYGAQGDISTAIDFYLTALKGAENANEAVATYKALGSAYLSAFDTTAAEICFIEALKLEPEDKEAQAGLVEARHLKSPLPPFSKGGGSRFLKGEYRDLKPLYEGL